MDSGILKNKSIIVLIIIIAVLAFVILNLADNNPSITTDKSIPNQDTESKNKALDKPNVQEKHTVTTLMIPVVTSTTKPETKNTLPKVTSTSKPKPSTTLRSIVSTTTPKPSTTYQTPTTIREVSGGSCAGMRAGASCGLGEDKYCMKCDSDNGNCVSAKVNTPCAIRGTDPATNEPLFEICKACDGAGVCDSVDDASQIQCGPPGAEVCGICSGGICDFYARVGWACGADDDPNKDCLECTMNGCMPNKDKIC